MLRASGLSVLSAAGLIVAGLVSPSSASADEVPAPALAFTAPAEGATVTGGALPVTLTSTAAFVRLTLGTGTPVMHDMTDTTAISLPTWGLHGAVALKGEPCPDLACTTPGDAVTVNVTVDNALPAVSGLKVGAVIGAPGAVVTTGGGGFVAWDVATPGGALADAVWSDTKAAGTPVSIPAATLAAGAYVLHARTCADAARTQCDPGSTDVAFSVRHVGVALTTPAVVSPNHDGLWDASPVTWSVSNPGVVTLKVLDAAGATRLGPLTLSNGAAGSATKGTWTFRGLDSKGKPLAHGTYRVAVTLTHHTGTQTLTATNLVNAVVDLRGPRITTARSAALFYPVIDGYQDTVTMTFAAGERSRGGRVLLKAPSGRTVVLKTLAASTTGRYSVAWNGRWAGAVVPGVYSLRAELSDAYGNKALSTWAAVSVSGKKLVKKTWTSTRLATSVYRDWDTAEDCTYGCVSEVTEPYSSEFGRYVVSVRPASDLTYARFSAALPTAVRYGTVRVDASGDSATADDVVALLYVKPTGEATGAGKALVPSNGSWQVGPTVSAQPMLSASHVVSWVVAGDQFNWYDLSAFRITATYYVLG